jgi:hypothetical protein
MKYNTEILINLPREKVLELFLNTEHLKKWQPGLLSYAHLDGEQGEEGSRSKQVFEGRKGELVITETITSKQLPEHIHMSYRSRGVYNEVNNRFTEQEAGITLWQIENNFRFRGIMMLMIPFMKNAFIHNTMLNMDRFKLFAEYEENK